MLGEKRFITVPTSAIRALPRLGSARSLGSDRWLPQECQVVHRVPHSSRNVAPQPQRGNPAVAVISGLSAGEYV